MTEATHALEAVCCSHPRHLSRLMCLIGLCALLALFSTACPDELQPDEEETCTAGTMACPCTSAGECFPEGELQLSCDRGWCVPGGDCALGAEACACYANGTCDSLLGVPMTCDGNVCRETPMPTPGTINGPCDATIPCDVVDGLQLECVSGVCQVPGCPSGELGCPCSAYGSCQMFAEQTVMCSNDVCVIGGCIEGQAGCNCVDPMTCEADLECLNNFCRYPNAMTVTVTDPNARACDILFIETDDRRVADVSFDAGVVGEAFNRSPRHGVSFFNRTNMPFAGEPVRVELQGGSPLLPSQLTVDSAVCFDGLGNVVPDGAVVVQ